MFVFGVFIVAAVTKKFLINTVIVFFFAEEAHQSQLVSQLSAFVSHSLLPSDGCLGEAGVLPPASPADCRWAHKAVQPASRETAVPELSAGPEAHRLVVQHFFSSFFFCPVCSAPRPLRSFSGYSSVLHGLDCTVLHRLVWRHRNRQAFFVGEVM